MSTQGVTSAGVGTWRGSGVYRSVVARTTDPRNGASSVYTSRAVALWQYNASGSFVEDTEYGITDYEWAAGCGGSSPITTAPAAESLLSTGTFEDI